MKKFVLTVLVSLLFFAAKTPLLAQEAETAMLHFAAIEQLPQDTSVSVPVYLNTQGKELTALQVQIDLEGEVEDLDVITSSQMPIQELSRNIENNSISISFTALELGGTWSTNESLELLSINFLHQGEGSVTFSFDQKESLAGDMASDGNVLTLGDDLVVQIGQIQAITSEIDEKTNQDVVEDTLTEPLVANSNNEDGSVQTIKNILIAIIVVLCVSAMVVTILFFKSKKRIDTKLETNPSQENPKTQEETKP